MKPIPFKNSYEQLGDAFYFKSEPRPVNNPNLILFNSTLALSLGLDGTELNENNAVQYLSGNKILSGSQPLAMAYSGHQFGHFSPQLGDGRAILLGSFRTPTGGLKDLQLKGSGKTHFSRGGDGRSALGPVLREYLVSEAMHHLGIASTRALAAVASGEKVVREKHIAGGIITRISNSFVRVGTFQYFSSQHDHKSIKKLADHVIKRNYPHGLNSGQKYRYLLKEVIRSQANLISKWMSVGFIHGVMNTDNMSICGETIDFGPCAFMDDFDFNKTFSFIDKQGRYAYSNQPHIALWDLTRFAESILSLLANEQETAIRFAEDELNKFPDLYEALWLEKMLKKIGLDPKISTINNTTEQKNKHKKLVENLLNVMAESKADFTQTFYELSNLSDQTSEQDKNFLDLFTYNRKIIIWLVEWRSLLAESGVKNSDRYEAMRKVNPLVIARNHQIEKAIRAAEDRNDFTPFYELNAILQTPYDDHKNKDKYRKPPSENEVVQQTFCGT